MTDKKEEFFSNLGRKVMDEFYGAPTQDVLEFAEKLKEWALQLPLTQSSVEKFHLRDTFYESKI
jgi:hypothetical protein